MLSRLTGTVALLVVLCFALPVIADAASAVPSLLSVLVLLAIVRLARPPSKRRW